MMKNMQRSIKVKTIFIQIYKTYMRYIQDVLLFAVKILGDKFVGIADTV